MPDLLPVPALPSLTVQPAGAQPEGADPLPGLLLAAEQAAGQSALGSLLPFALLAIAFYFLLIRPQRKRAQEAAQVRASLRVGAEVLTTSGLYGTVALVEDQAVLLEVAPGVTNRYDKRAIATVLDAPSDAPEEDEDAEALDPQPGLSPREDLPADDPAGRSGSADGPDGPPAARGR